MDRMSSNHNCQYVEIDGRKIGKDYPPYIVAELSANHNGDLNKALECIAKAKEMGADAIKIQTYTPDTMTLESDKDDFKIKGGVWDGYRLHDLYKEAQTPYEWHKPLFDKAREMGITLFSSPFDETAVDLLESLDVPAYKIASFELVDIPLIEYVAKKGKPIIMSTGMANKEEIETAVTAAKNSGCNDIILLHCISAYPAPINESNLNAISMLEKDFDVISGLSDHSLGLAASITSVALGGCFVEKHFTLDRKDGGPDSAFSIEPSELKMLCEETKNAWLSLGCVGYERKSSEQDNIKFRRSLYIVKDMKKGDVLTEENLRRIRPGYGLAPKYYNALLGKVVTKEVSSGTAMDWSFVK